MRQSQPSDSRSVVCRSGRNDAADVARSLAAGELVPTPKPQTIADGLQGDLAVSISVQSWQTLSLGHRKAAHGSVFLSNFPNCHQRALAVPRTLLEVMKLISTASLGR